MNWFDVIQWFYSEGLWTADQIKDAVQLGKITAEQYKEITGEDYAAQ